MIIGITRSGKGEMYVFPIIDIYSRAENKQYSIQYILDKNEVQIFASNIYYDPRKDGERTTDIPVQITEKQLNLSEKELATIVKKLVLDEKLDKSMLHNNEYDFFDYLDDETNEYDTEEGLYSIKDRVTPKRFNNGNVELSLLARMIKIEDLITKQTNTYIHLFLLSLLIL